MVSHVYSAAIVGVDAVPVTVEADLCTGLPGFTMVGFLSSQVREAQDRVRTALRNAGYEIPARRVTINLSPADLRKEGSRFDLPIALAVLTSMGEIGTEALAGCLIAGELSLTGEIRPVSGILATVLLAREKGFGTCIVPRENVNEGGLVEGIRTVGTADIGEAVRFLRTGEGGILPGNEPDAVPLSREDFSDIRGQRVLKRAALIAVSGFHNLLMSGPPGAGKSMTARRIPGILPPLTKEEMLEVTRIHSIAGLLPSGGRVLRERPFRAPHHTVSPYALAGGGRVPAPGEITLAHRGVLFLDEMPEFSRAALETLRQPLEEREIVITRTYGTFTFPASFLLIAAMNPCPCGYYPDMRRCTCSAQSLQRYRSRISRPLLDRIDVCVQAPAVTYEMLTAKEPDPVSSAVLRSEAERVFAVQKDRFAGTSIRFNADIPPAKASVYCPMSPAAERLLSGAFGRFGLSARAYHRILKVARTVADLAGEETIGEDHMREALFYRMREELK